MDDPIRAVMTPEPITLPAHVFAVEAALAMARHGVHHIVVADGNRIVGLVSAKDLFALQQAGITQISIALRQAAGVSELVELSRSIRELAANLLQQGSARKTSRVSSRRSTTSSASGSSNWNSMLRDLTPRISAGSPWAAKEGTNRHLRQTRTTASSSSIRPTGMRTQSARSCCRPRGGSTTISMPAGSRSAAAASWQATRAGA